MSKPYIPNDKLTKKAKKENFRARSIYKLQELDHRYRLVQPGMKILDIAAAPGSWSQYCSEKVGEAGHILSVDIQEIKPIAQNVTTAVCDMRNIEEVKNELNKLGWEKVDLIISDIAASTTGIIAIDHSRSIELNTAIFETSKGFLKPGKKLVMKVFDGSDFTKFIQKLHTHFSKVETYRAKSSRERSKEVYVICW